MGSETDGDGEKNGIFMKGRGKPQLYEILRLR